MANAEFAGSAAYCQLITSGGTWNVHTDSRNVTYTPSIDFIDATAGADTARRRINSYKDGVMNVTTLAQSDADGSTCIVTCQEGLQGTVTWGIAGTATGARKSVMPVISMGVVQTAPYNDVVTYSVTLQQNGARTDSAW